MTVRVLVGDVYGRILAEIEPDVGAVTSRLNAVGQCTFSLAKTDSKALEENLHFGNRILVQFDNGLRDWGGIIDPPRDWGLANVTCTAYSGEYIFGMRQTDKGRYFSGATVGAIYQSLIDEANAQRDMGIALGSVWTGGEGHSPDYHFKNLLDIFQDSLCDRLSDADFDVTASEASGKIVFTANLYERKGTTRTDYPLIESANAQVARFSEQGYLVNWWDLAGEGSDWGDNRIFSHTEDATSIGVYGLRQGSQIYSDVSVQATLDAHATNALAQSKDPHNMLELVTLDAVPARFRDYDVGDTVPLSMHSMGFGGLETTVRIWGRTYSPNLNLCGLVVREEA